jgi:hypothetical protein
MKFYRFDFGGGGEPATLPRKMQIQGGEWVTVGLLEGRVVPDAPGVGGVPCVPTPTMGHTGRGRAVASTHIRVRVECNGDVYNVESGERIARA